MDKEINRLAENPNTITGKPFVVITKENFVDFNIPKSIFKKAQDTIDTHISSTPGITKDAFSLIAFKDPDGSISEVCLRKTDPRDEYIGFIQTVYDPNNPNL